MRTPRGSENHATRSPLPALILIALVPIFGVLTACATPPAGQSPETAVPLRSAPGPGDSKDTARARSGSGPRESSVALLIGGEPVTWGTLRPLLAEAGGGEVVEDLVLEHALRAELRARGMTIGDAQIASARDSWLALLEDAGLSTQAESEIRRRRGLGEERFRRLLWRNAALRALIDPAEIAVGENEVAMARSIRAGRRYLLTGVIVRDSETALEIARRARAAGGNVGSAAGALYAESAARDLTPFRSVVSPLDPAYPESIRRVLGGMPAGSVSSAIAVDSGFAVVVVDGIVEGSGAAGDAGSIRRELTIRKTRLAMERLARSLVDRTEVSVLDRSLPQ